jgi:hypothetical protein
MNIIKIGANKWNDDLSVIIGNNQSNKLILVELIEKYFYNIMFIETYHKLQYTGSWDNEKLLVLFINYLML